MINELNVIAQGLDEIGEGPELMHKDIYLPGGKEALRIILGKKATIESVEYMNSDKLANSWGLRKSNQDQFPGIKLTFPLRRQGNLFHSSYNSFLTGKNKQTAEHEFIERCNQFEVDFNQFTAFKETERNRFLLQKFPHEENMDGETWPKAAYRKSILERYEMLRVCDDKEIQIVSELYHRYSEFENNGIALLIKLDGVIEELVLKGSSGIPNKLLLNILFGEKRINNKNELPDSRPLLFLDFKPQKHIDEFVFTPKRKRVIADFLNETTAKDNNKSGISYLSGKEVNIITDNFPEKNLGKGKSVSTVRLFSKFDANGGQTTVHRYHRSGADSYLLGIEEGNRLAGALAKLTKDEFRGKTWDSIPSEKKKTNDLLIAFYKSSAHIAITPLITGSGINDIDDYLDITQNVINALKASDLTLDNRLVDFIVLRKINDGNQKVIYSTTKSVDSLQKASSEWIKACNNCPDFKLSAQLKTKSKFLKPWPIAPIESIYLTKNKYIRDGLSSLPVNSMSFAETMSLFMSQSANVKALALRNIEKLTNQVEPLFRYCSLSKNQNLLSKNNQRLKTKNDKNTLVLKMVTLLGVLLYKADKKKEEYMNDFAYQLGQLCSVMDELHIGYCQDIRKGDIPNTLIGNATYSIALQSPLKALSFLASRIKPYKAWAIKIRSQNKKIDDKVIKAGLFAFIWLEKNSPNIEKYFSDNDQLADDTYKAEIMLGYLAGRPFEKS